MSLDSKNKVITLDDFRPHFDSDVRCLSCAYYFWVVAPIECFGEFVECPKCGDNKGFILGVKPDEN